MQIIAGKYKNRKIATPPNEKIRPVLTRVRKSLFDILEPHLKGAQMLDLYSGTGIMALEAFSRGAASVTSVDMSPVALDLAKSNHAKICPDEDYRILRGNVLETIPRLALQGNQFDVIGVTPPYGQNLVNKTLQALDRATALLKEETVIYTQRDKEEEVSLEWQNLEFVRVKKYGRTILEFFLPKEGFTPGL